MRNQDSFDCGFLQPLIEIDLTGRVNLFFESNTRVDQDRPTTGFDLD